MRLEKVNVKWWSHWIKLKYLSSVRIPKMPHVILGSVTRIICCSGCRTFGRISPVHTDAALIATHSIEQTISAYTAKRGWDDWARILLSSRENQTDCLTKKRILTVYPIQVDEITVKFKAVVKYLAIIIDSRIISLELTRRLAGNIAAGIFAISRPIANAWCRVPDRRLFLISSMQFDQLYDSKVWASAPIKQIYYKCHRKHFFVEGVKYTLIETML